MFLIPTSRPKWWAPLLCSLIFFCLGLPFLGYPGIQQDEALCTAPIYNTSHTSFSVAIFHHRIPLMVMSYVGALKTWLYVPIFRVIRPSYLSIRVPVLLLGSAAVWLFFDWLQITHGQRAAWIGALLLATDTMFLLTTCFDWGPVALQHFLTLSGVVLVLHFHHKRSMLALAGAFFCFGLALWDKALFVWVFTGLLCAVPLLFPREVLRNLTWKTGTVATLGFLIGASPLIAYNVIERFPTFHAASAFSTQDMSTKVVALRGTWAGAALLGYLPAEDFAPNPRQPRTRLQSFSFWLRSVAGEHRRNALNWAVFAGLALLIPALWWPESRRMVLLCLVVIAIAWLQMAITNGAGGSAHHIVLLWPFPHAALAIVFAEATRRAGPRLSAIAMALLVAGMMFLVGANLLVTNQYLYQFARNGSAGSWSDAIYTLRNAVRALQPQPAAVIDWGMINSLELLERGRLNLVWVGGAFLIDSSPTDSPDPALLNNPETLWISHVNGREEFAGINARFAAFAKRAGYEQVPVAAYTDSNGRAVFESFHLRK